MSQAEKYRAYRKAAQALLLAREVLLAKPADTLTGVEQIILDLANRVAQGKPA